MHLDFSLSFISSIHLYFDLRIFDFQEYNSRKLTDDGEHATKPVMYFCPFANQCGCPVKFRVFKTEREVFLNTHEKHTSERHSTDQMLRGFTLLQKEASQSAVRMQVPLMSAEIFILWRKSVGMKLISRLPRDLCREKWPKCAGKLSQSLRAT